ncbi:unnamed protein product [Allacma fusca]|uniref:Uncharacterized protein n=1 Tax=Allacma fusca TaxID=39272 RepID=A0A8J2L3E1_9HEXA|nr:unnamed protein product [Allacma fusca]
MDVDTRVDSDIMQRRESDDKRKSPRISQLPRRDSVPMGWHVEEPSRDWIELQKAKVKKSAEVSSNSVRKTPPYYAGNPYPL